MRTTFKQQGSHLKATIIVILNTVRIDDSKLLEIAADDKAEFKFWLPAHQTTLLIKGFGRAKGSGATANDFQCG